jgi:aspartyl protease family protein
MREYKLESYGNLFLTRAAVGGKDGVRVVKLLIDTGSSYTILPFEILEAIGSSPILARERVRLATASGYIIAPAVRVEWFNCLGYRVDAFRVVSRTLPFGTFIDGLLGMDFLTKIGAIINTTTKSIIVS